MCEQARRYLALAVGAYRHVLYDRLMRNKQLAIILVALVFPTLGAVISVLIDPLRALFGDARLFARSVVLSVYLATLMVWCTVQRNAISPPDQRAFLASLPLSPFMVLLSDAVILALADLPLFVPLVCAAILEMHDTATVAVGAPVLMSIVSAAIVAQMGLLRHRPSLVVAAIAAQAAAVLMLPDMPWPVAVMWLVAVLPVVVAILAYRRGTAVWRTVAGGSSMHAKRPMQAGSLLAINATILRTGSYSNYRVTAAIIVALAILATLKTIDALMRRSDEGVMGILIVIATVSTTLSCTALATIRDIRNPLQGFVSSLPFGEVRIATADLSAVLTVPCMLLLPAMVLTLFLPGHAVSAVLATCLTVAILGVANYPLYGRVPRHALALATCAAVAWLSASYSLSRFLT